jgi:hypothetical protein
MKHEYCPKKAIFSLTALVAETLIWQRSSVQLEHDAQQAQDCEGDALRDGEARINLSKRSFSLVAPAAGRSSCFVGRPATAEGGSRNPALSLVLA